MAECPGIATEIIMPKLGLTMAEGLIAEWCVKPGDEVSAGQLLFVVETDKISNEIEAPAPGRIVALLVGQGATVTVGTPVATWTGPVQGGVLSAKAEAEALPAPIAMMPAAPERRNHTQRILSTPFARRLAQQGGIDIARVPGTGARGRVQARDVQAVLQQPSVDQPVRPTPQHRQARDMRALIAARVSRSKAEIPHFYLTADVAFDALTALRRDLNADPLAPRKLSVTTLLAIAVARALKLRPEANVVWRDAHAVLLHDVAIAIAVETEGGVIAPVIPITGDIYAFAIALDAAINRARAGRLAAADAGQAAIGISNVGMFQVRALTPIIDPDQTYMLGVGAPRTSFRPSVNGAPVAVQEVTLSLACDHRAIDGAAAARFLATVVELLEKPGRLLIQGR
jgi:pyruvate dehydrogenase E2 component (dihydrolipoamide acetyltransferase)